MKFPSLVRKQFCKQPVWLTIYSDGLNEDGAPIEIHINRKIYPSENIFPSDILHGDPIYCNFQEEVKTVFTSDRKKVQANGVVLIPHDIMPNTATISGGYVTINGVKRDIVKCIKARNPDGTVNFVELDVI